MGRRRGYGQLDESKQELVLRLVRVRKRLTNREIAKRVNASIEAVKGCIKRERKRLNSVDVSRETNGDPLCLNANVVKN